MNGIFKFSMKTLEYFLENLIRASQSVMKWVSGEFLLIHGNSSNGGTVILLRSVLIAIEIFVPTILVLMRFTPDCPSFWELASMKLTWFGALFAASYAAFYSRFSSQWLYLSNLYNSIKSSTLKEEEEDSKAIASWKAAFIEDADNLHMVRKNSIAPIIRSWGKKELVKQCFIKSSPGGELRFNRILNAAISSCEKIERKHEKYV